MSMFASAPARDLREVGHSKTVEKFKVKEHHKRAMDPVDIRSWTRGLLFGNVLLPGATAEISPTPDKGSTRLVIHFLRASNSMNADEAITSICAMTFYFAYLHDEELVQSTRLERVTHKTDVKQEGDMLWVNKSCGSNRMATTIKTHK